jgi:hypothetical protein
LTLFRLQDSRSTLPSWQKPGHASLQARRMPTA